MPEPKLFSADSHVNEPPEAWERIPKNLREHGRALFRTRPAKKASIWFSTAMSRTRWE